MAFIKTILQGFLGLKKDPNATTQDVAVIKSEDTNAGIAIVPNGTGAITADIPNGTVAGGNARGQNSVDFQKSRTSNAQVAFANNSFIGGGRNNTVSIGYGNNEGGVVVGGVSNTVGANYGFIGGGSSNSLGGNDNYQVIVGGVSNSINASGGAFIGGGLSNSISGGGTGYQVIAGGRSNVGGSTYTVISGGQSNTANSGSHATVVGGYQNSSTGQYSISGGYRNTASGQGAISLGAGIDSTNIASNTSSIAIGNRVSVQGVASVSIGSTLTTNSGSGSLVVGQGSTNSGSGNAVFGSSNNSSSNFSLVFGRYTIGAYQGALSFQSGIPNTAQSNKGIAQSHQLTMQKTADLNSSATTTLAIDGVSAFLIPRADNIGWNVTVKTIAIVTTITGTASGVSVGDTFMENKSILFKRIGGVSNVVDLATDNVFADGGMGTSAMTYTAGASQELALTYQAPSFGGGGSLTVRVVSKVELVEVAY